MVERLPQDDGNRGIIETVVPEQEFRHHFVFSLHCSAAGKLKRYRVLSSMLSPRVQATIRKFSMIAPGERVLVGLSGGADSVCLLIVLRELGYHVAAAHLNHGLRGEESDHDETFVRTLCAQLQI